MQYLLGTCKIKGTSWRTTLQALKFLVGSVDASVMLRELGQFNS